jgi:hypothetical protein
VLGRPLTSDFTRCDCRAVPVKHMVLYGSARTGDYLIVAIKKSQRVPFPGRHDCRWTAACTNETLKLKLNSMALVRDRTIPTERPPPVGEVRNKWVRAHERLSPPYLCMKPALSKGISLRTGGDINTQNLCPL